MNFVIAFYTFIKKGQYFYIALCVLLLIFLSFKRISVPVNNAVIYRINPPFIVGGFNHKPTNKSSFIFFTTDAYVVKYNRFTANFYGKTDSSKIYGSVVIKTNDTLDTWLVKAVKINGIEWYNPITKELSYYCKKTINTDSLLIIAKNINKNSNFKASIDAIYIDSIVTLKQNKKLLNDTIISNMTIKNKANQYLYLKKKKIPSKIINLLIK